jgi:hypothetical protein
LALTDVWLASISGAGSSRSGSDIVMLVASDKAKSPGVGEGITAVALLQIDLGL